MFFIDYANIFPYDYSLGLGLLNIYPVEFIYCEWDGDFLAVAWISWNTNVSANEIASYSLLYTML
jgi:hypothetical protein